MIKCITYEHSGDYINAINKYQALHGVLANSVRNKTRLATQICLYNNQAISVVLYENRTWTTTKIKKQRLQTLEMKFHRRNR